MKIIVVLLSTLSLALLTNFPQADTQQQQQTFIEAALAQTK